MRIMLSHFIIPIFLLLNINCEVMAKRIVTTQKYNGVVLDINTVIENKDKFEGKIVTISGIIDQNIWLHSLERSEDCKLGLSCVIPVIGLSAYECRESFPLMCNKRPMKDSKPYHVIITGMFSARNRPYVSGDKCLGESDRSVKEVVCMSNVDENTSQAFAIGELRAITIYKLRAR